MDILLLTAKVLIFLFATVVCFTNPGIFLLQKAQIKLAIWEKICLSTVVGFTFFTLLSLLLHIIQLPLLLLPIIFVINFLVRKELFKVWEQISWPATKELITLLIIFGFGVLGQLLIIAPSATYQNGDLVFWSSHGHDGLWHISLMTEYQKGYPLQNPVLANQRLINYHFFSDIAPAEFNYYFRLPLLDLYFRLFPLILSIFLGSLAYLLGKKLGGNSEVGLWAAIFTYFSGSFGYIVTYLQNKTFGGESLFWDTQIQSSICNPPQIASLIIILAFLYLFSNFLENRNKWLLLICVGLVGSLAGFKIYAAVVLIISLFLTALWQLVREKQFQIMQLFLGGALLSATIYLPNSSFTSGTFLIFEPWWFIRTMVVAPDRLNWIDLELKRQTYVFEGNWKRVIQTEVIAFLIFFFGNLGMRFIGLWNFQKMAKSIFTNYFNQLFILIATFSFILPILFLQKGVATNTIQFLQYFILLFGILAALTIHEIFRKIKFKILTIFLAISIIILSIPTQLALIYNFYNRLPFAKITAQELIALRFLKERGVENSVILTPPYNKYLDQGESIPQIWDWSDTSYVAALSAKRVFLTDTEQVDIMGYDFKTRQLLQEEIFTQTDPVIFTNTIKEAGINHLYFPKLISPAVELNKTTLRKIYENDLIEIWVTQ